MEPDANNTYAKQLQQLLAPVTEAIGGYDQLDLLQSVGALGLIPENADHQIRLEAFAHTVAAFPQSTRRHATDHRLRSWLNSAPFTGQPIGTAEDPCENAFTEEVTFSNSSYLIIPGRGEEITFQLRQLAASLNNNSARKVNQNFITAARETISTVLILSNEMAKSS